MADSFQNEVPKARINLKLDLHTGGASKKMELPLKLLVAGDFSNGQDTAPIFEREKVNITKNNFDSVLSEYSPKVNLTVKNTLADDGGEDNIQLTFQSMKDFTPEQVAAQIPALYDTADATANSRINARLPYIFLLSRIAHYLKLIQRENIGTTKDRRLLELELNTWVRSLVTEMTDPGDELQASHPLRDAKVVVEDIEDNPGFFRVKLYAIPHFQVEGMDVNLSLVSQMPKAKA
ncbi:TPA: type VI secretion system contractile sheath small subunit [Enterobacter bugandensis]